MISTLGLPLSAHAATGGTASAQAVQLNVGANVIGLNVGLAGQSPLVNAPGANTPGQTATNTNTAGASLTSQLLASANAQVTTASASRGPDNLSSTSQVTGLGVGLFGANILSADAVSSSSVCTVTGGGDASSTVAGVRIGGQLVNLTANARVNVPVGVNVLGLAGARVNVDLGRVETDGATSARGAGLEASLTLQANVLATGLPLTVNLGTLRFAESQCTIPTAADNTQPSLVSAAPNNVPTSGGATVVLTGTNLNGATGVTVGGVPAQFTVNSATQITVTTPASEVAGFAPVIVTTPTGQARTDITYNPPTIAAVNPGSGPLAGGNTVTVTGTGFVPASSVTFGGVASPQTTFVNATTLQAVVPAGAAVGTVDVNVVQAGVDASFRNGYGYVAAPVPTPTITSTDPTNGSTKGNQVVTVTGTNLLGATATVNGVSAPVSNVTATSLQFTTPASETDGPAAVSIITPNGTVNTTFTYVAPTITSITPFSGAPAGGTRVTITGTDLANPESVLFGGVAGTDVVAAADGTSIQVTTPAGAASSTVPVNVTFPGRDVQTSFTYTTAPIPAPTITSVSPASGPTSGGTELTIEGTNLTADTVVNVDGQDLPIVSRTGTSVTVVVPATENGGTVPVNVRTGTGSATSSFTYVSPTITNLTPNSGPAAGGAAVTLQGTGLTGATDVLVGGVGASGVTVNPEGTSITFTTPAGEAGTTVPVVVVLPGQDATLANAYSYVTVPVDVTGISPGNVPTSGGTVVTVTGTGFTANTRAMVGSTMVETTLVPGGFTFVAPPQETAGTFTVEVSDPDSNGDTVELTYVAPTLTSLSPATGPAAGGTRATLQGSGLTGATDVLVGGTRSTDVVVNADGTAVSFTTPAGLAGSVVGVSVVLPGLDANLDNAFRYAVVPLDVTGATPGNVPTSGGSRVEVAGTGFTTRTTVVVDGQLLPSELTDTGIAFTTLPRETAGPVEVVVTDPDAGTDTTQLVYDAPTLVDLDRDNGPATGGTVVTAFGSGFNNVQQVLVGGAPATNVVASPDGTSVTFTTPAGLVNTTVPLSIVLPGQDATLANAFRYTATPVDITGISPGSLPTSGGTLTLTGTGFTVDSVVTIDGNPVPATLVDGTLVVAAPSREVAGLALVEVNDPNGGFDSTEFAYVAPVVLAVNPGTGPAAGGTPVTLQGSGLGGATDVLVGGVPATDVVVSPDGTSVTFVTPAGPGGSTVPLVVVLPGLDATAPNGFTYQVAPIVVTGLNPGGIPTSGAEVTVTGSGFTPQTTVTVGGIPVPATLTDAGLVFTAPAVEAAGSVPVVVSDPVAGSGSTNLIYVAPTLGTLDPSTGPAAGGTVVTAPGSGLGGATGVLVGGVPATDVVASPDGTSVTFTTPAGTGGATVPVTVVLPGADVTDNDAFTYQAVPVVVDTITPSTLPTSGGEITIGGTGFTPETTVTIGDTEVPAVLTDEGLVVTVPPSETSGPVQVVVTDPQGGTGSGTITYAAPALTSVTPSSGGAAGGTTVTATGTGLGGATGVLVGGAAATNVVASPDGTSVTFTTPAGLAGSVAAVTVVLPGADATLENAYRYTAPVAITGITPGTLPTSGGQVTIEGTGFTPDTTVTIGGVEYPAVLTDGDLVVTLPSSETGGTAQIVVTDPVNGTDTGSVAYAAPTITDVTPGNGPAAGGTSVTLTGTGLNAVTDVLVGGVPATDVVASPDGTSITFTTPAGVAGTSVPVTVVLPGADALQADAFAYDAVPVDVTGISPSTLPTSGGVVTLTGTGLTPETTVTVDGAPVDATFDNGQVTFTAPPRETPGPVQVVVQSPGAGSDNAEITYVAPTLTAVTPNTGPATGGTTVTATGTGLGGATGVLVGGAAATDVVASQDGTSVTFTTPVGLAGSTAAVTVVLPGADATLLDAYRYAAAPLNITGVTPGTLPTTGGTVTVDGTGFTPETTVTVDGTPVTVTLTDGQITFTAPPRETPGIVQVVVTDPERGSDTTEISYVAPAVTSLTPAAGPEAGGTRVTIQGTGLTGATDVLFGGVSGTDLVVAADGNSLQVTTPVNTPGEVDVTVVLPGADAPSPQQFLYTFAPVVLDGLNPGTVSTTGGTEVQVDGTGFGPGTTVTVDGVLVPVTVSDGTVTFVAPTRETPGVVQVVVTDPERGSGTTELVYVAPSVASMTPASGPVAGGNVVTIEGSGFAPDATVTFGGIAGTDVQVNADGTVIQVTVPAGAAGQTVPVVVVQAGADALVPGGYAYEGVVLPGTPVITSIAPASGPTSGGTLVRVEGTNVTDATEVFVDGINVPVLSRGEGFVTVSMPSREQAGSASIQLVDGERFSEPRAYEYVAPVVTSITPASGPADQAVRVTIRGTGLTGATGVLFGGVSGTDLVVAEDGNSLQVTVPAGGAGKVDVTVVLPGLDARLVDGYERTTVTDPGPGVPAPVVTNLSTQSGPTSGGQVVTIRGTGFTPGSIVTFGGVAGTVEFVDATTLRVTTPARESGGEVPVLVSSAGGASQATSYQYVSPSITRLDPAVGSTNGGLKVRLYGTGFTPDARVLVDGTAVQTTFVDAGTLEFFTPVHPVGKVDVTVVLPGQDATAAGAFEFFARPVVSGVSTQSGPTSGGTILTLTGTGFTTDSVVTIGGNRAVVEEVTSTSIRVRVPASEKAGLVDVVVTNGGGDSIPAAFTYTAPSITSITPNQGNVNGGNTVTISGTGFTPDTKVQFGGKDGEVTYVDSTTLQVKVPAGVVGKVDVNVILPGLDTAQVAGYEYVGAGTNNPGQGNNSGNPGNGNQGGQGNGNQGNGQTNGNQGNGQGGQNNGNQGSNQGNGRGNGNQGNSPRTSNQGGNLAYTGSEPLPIVFFGLTLMGLGILIRRISKK